MSKLEYQIKYLQDHRTECSSANVNWYVIEAIDLAIELLLKQRNDEVLQDIFENTLSELYDVTTERDRFRKAFSLACRYLGDREGCPVAVDVDVDFPECDGESEQCGDKDLWHCWERYFVETVDEIQVCRVCGCTNYNACPGGCYWVEPDLCSACADGCKDQA